MTQNEDVKGRLWFERDYPVLRATAELIEESGRGVTSDRIAERATMQQADVVRALRDLSTRFLDVQDVTTYDGEDYYALALTADGLVAADLWPSSDTVAERLIDALERALDEAPSDSPKATRIRAALDSMKDLGVGGAGNVLGQAISSALGL
ncbi:hypothetical protein IM660_10325 [Ruania alkalisoli]|uniref:Uncharacterized protein n=1 Tax=Ruania alkalisoli TaxID=2779775 RepID=A0A7M1SNH5_9MICO|nr:hypothetical protein [Ruania alkalisoli]QOR69130.1 hypothetical protein IM660_10325 [Ruania alkalisoli]